MTPPPPRRAPPAAARSAGRVRARARVSGQPTRARPRGAPASRCRGRALRSRVPRSARSPAALSRAGACSRAAALIAVFGVRAARPRLPAGLAAEAQHRDQPQHRARREARARQRAGPREHLEARRRPPRPGRRRPARHGDARRRGRSASSTRAAPGAARAATPPRRAAASIRWPTSLRLSQPPVGQGAAPAARRRRCADDHSTAPAATAPAVETPAAPTGQAPTQGAADGAVRRRLPWAGTLPRARRRSRPPRATGGLQFNGHGRLRVCT